MKVYQLGGAILLLSQNVHEVGPEGGLIQVEIKSNFDFEIEIKADWVSTSYSRNMSSHTIYLRCLLMVCMKTDRRILFSIKGILILEIP